MCLEFSGHVYHPLVLGGEGGQIRDQATPAISVPVACIHRHAHQCENPCLGSILMSVQGILAVILPLASIANQLLPNHIVIFSSVVEIEIAYFRYMTVCIEV